MKVIWEPRDLKPGLKLIQILRGGGKIKWTVGRVFRDFRESFPDKNTVRVYTLTTESGELVQIYGTREKLCADLNDIGEFTLNHRSGK